MIVVYGTTGELIKIAPLLLELERRGSPAFTVTTAQQAEQIPPLLADFGLRPPDLWLARGHRGRDLARPLQIPGWLAGVAGRAAGNRARLRRGAARNGRRPLVLVHGDTFTTVLGALLGRILRAPVAHVEAGLRSGDWRNPFPEELNRRVTSRIARIHFAPGAWAAGNLRRARVRGEIVDLGANTVLDSLRAAADRSPEIPLPDGDFGLASVHRFELLGDRARLRETMRLLHHASRRIPILFVDHPVTAMALRRHGLDGFLDHGLRRIPRQRYQPFVALLSRSRFLFTDSGGSQEECALLGHPCLVHRATTERREGLEAGGTVILSRMDPSVAERFLEGPWVPRRPSAAQPEPTRTMLDWLEARGFV